MLPCAVSPALPMSQCAPGLLIEAVHKETVLYDTSHPDYMKTKLKDELWNRIAKGIHFMKDGVAAKTAWLKLRNCHRDALRRQKKYRKSGAPAANIKKWKFQMQMEFLVPYMTNRRRESNIDDDDDSDYEESQGNSQNIERESDEVANPNAGIENEDNENTDIESAVTMNVEVENIENEYLETENTENENTVTEESERHNPDNVDIIATPVVSTEFPASNTTATTPQTKRTKKDEITSLFKQSMQQHAERAQRRATERKNLEQVKAPNDHLYHFFMSMYEITKKMPPASQHIVRNNVFQAVSQVEADILNITQERRHTQTQFPHQQPQSIQSQNLFNQYSNKSSSSASHSTHSSISMPLSSPLTYYDSDSRDIMSPPQSAANTHTLINYINAFSE